MQSGNPFQDAEDKYFALRGKLETKRITPEQFESALKELMVKDAQGRFWMLGVDSGKWYVHDGETWVEANPPGMVGRESKPVPVLISTTPSSRTAPSTQSQQSPARGSRKLLALVVTICGGLLILLVGLAAMFGQDNIRSVLLGSPPTSTLAPTRTLVARVPTAQVIIVTETAVPTLAPTRTNTPTATRTATSVPSTATPFPPGAIPTFSPNVITWSTGYDETAGKPVNIVANRTFTPPPLEIYASWAPSGIAAGTKLQIAWYYAGTVWAQTEYTLQTGDTEIWHSASRADGKLLTPGNYRVEVKADGKVILADQVVVR